MTNLSTQEPARMTATCYTLTEEWKAGRAKVDWIKAPEVEAYVNSLVSGIMGAGGHWALYALREHLNPLMERKGPLAMASLGCGSAHIEASLLREFKWPVTRLVGLEYDEQLRASATALFRESFPDVQSEFRFFDFNNPEKIGERFDVIFVCHALHHAEDLEALLPVLNSYLKDDGLFIGIDFFGPTRFQIEFDVLPLIKELFSFLPPHFRRDLRYQEDVIPEQFEVDTIEMVRSADRSESVRSSDLRTLLFSNFPIKDIKMMGGTLLRWLLANRAGNFLWDNSDHVAIMKLLIFIEREMLASRRIRSDDLFFVLGKSNRL